MYRYIIISIDIVMQLNTALLNCSYLFFKLLELCSLAKQTILQKCIFLSHGGKE